MEIRIGVQHVNREVVLESNEALAAVQKSIDAALSSGSLLTLTDEKGPNRNRSRRQDCVYRNRCPGCWSRGIHSHFLIFIGTY